MEHPARSGAAGRSDLGRPSGFPTIIVLSPATGGCPESPVQRPIRRCCTQCAPCSGGGSWLRRCSRSTWNYPRTAITVMRSMSAASVPAARPIKGAEHGDMNEGVEANRDERQVPNSPPPPVSPAAPRRHPPVEQLLLRGLPSAVTSATSTISSGELPVTISPIRHTAR